MPCGPALINAVAGVLNQQPVKPSDIQRLLPGHYSLRAIRYAVKALVESGKAKRKGTAGPVTAVVAELARALP